MNADVRDAYLRRLGVDREPPSADALIRLHRAHAERVSYETVWIHLGERWGVGTDDAVMRIATQGRGGYCYHLNGAFSELLRALGYRVQRHIGGVHGPDGPSVEALTNHLVLTVHDLPTDACPDGIWYVDVGLGDALHDALPLVAGAYVQSPWKLSLEHTPGEVGDWHLTHDPRGSFPGMSWRRAPCEIDAFATRHEWLSTDPESGFVKVLVVQKRDATSVTMLRGLVSRKVSAGREDEAIVTSEPMLFDLLGDEFGLDLTPVSAEARGALWERLCRAHEAWEAAGRP